MVTVSVLISCEEASSGSDNTTEEAPGAIIATQTPKRAATDVRDSYGIFTIKTDSGSYTDYHLAVKEASVTAPTATEMVSGALKRNISKTEIHVLIAQRMNAPMVTFAEAYFADNTKKTLGTGMKGDFHADGTSLIYDNSATDSNAWVANSVLKPNTQYTLYGMVEGGDSVTELLKFTTDASSQLGENVNVDQALVDSTLEETFTLSITRDEYYVFPLQLNTAKSQDALGGIQISANYNTDDIVIRQDMSIFDNDSALANNVLVMVANTGANNLDNLFLHAYLLIKTDAIPETYNSVYFSRTAPTTVDALPTIFLSSLAFQ